MPNSRSKVFITEKGAKAPKSVKKKQITLFPIHGDQSFRPSKPDPTSYVLNYGEYEKIRRNPLFGTSLYSVIKHRLSNYDQITRQLFIETFYDVVENETYRNMYEAEIEKRIWYHIRQSILARKTNRVYAFDLSDIFHGVPDGHTYATSQLVSALGQLGATNNGSSLFPIWRQLPDDDFIRNILHPLWSLTPYSPTTLLDVCDVKPHTLDARFWVVKADTSDMVEQCKTYKVRSCPHYKLLIGKSKKISEVKSEIDFVNWQKQSWSGCHAVWYMNATDARNERKLTTLSRTLRFI